MREGVEEKELEKYGKEKGRRDGGRGLSSPSVGVENPPSKQSYSPWRRTINFPRQGGSTCFDDQLTRPLHAILLLQHETEGIHATKN